MEQKPERKYLKLKVENNKTFEVQDFDLAEFIAAVEKRSPAEGLEASRSGAEPVDATLYPLPDNSSFLESAVQNLKAFKPAMDKEKKTASCDKKPGKRKFAHQEVLAAYFNVQNPYRGILIYHGMGSGKTCSSVAMAENLAGNERPIWVLTPKALEANYKAEMVKCSNVYKQSQHWAARKQGWVVLQGRPANFDELGPKEQQEVTAHLAQLIDREKAYRFVSYSGMSCQNIRAQFTEDNPFENAVVVIDEVHLLVDLIAKNKKNNASPFPLLYEWLLDAEGCRVIALSGTPRANKVTDLGVLYNLLYGYIKVWTVNTPKLVEDPKLKRFIHQQRSVGKKLQVTRTPHGFEAQYDDGAAATGALVGLRKVDDTWDDHKFRTELAKHGVVGDRVEKHKLLPDVRRGGCFPAADPRVDVVLPRPGAVDAEAAPKETARRTAQRAPSERNGRLPFAFPSGYASHRPETVGRVPDQHGGGPWIPGGHSENGGPTERKEGVQKVGRVRSETEGSGEARRGNPNEGVGVHGRTGERFLHGGGVGGRGVREASVVAAKPAGANDVGRSAFERSDEDVHRLFGKPCRTGGLC